MSVLANKIGEMLLKGNLITADQLRGALETQEKTHERIGTVLVKAGFIKEEELLAFLGRQFNLPVVDLSKYEINPEVVRLLPEEMVQKHLALPINRVGSKMIVAVADPSNMAIIDGIGFKTGYSVELVLASERAITAEINKFFDRSMEFKDIISELDEDLEVIREEEVDTADLERGVDDAPVVKLANYLLTEAIKRRASDIHIEPYEKEFRVRYRVDGVLFEVMRPPLRLRNALSSRLKIMASLDIAERRLPQDGRIKMKIGKGREMDFRVSVLPTIHGEKIVLRLLDKASLQLDMTKLGFEPAQLVDFNDSIHRPFGMILVTGPTGSGKTTTLYSALVDLNKVTRQHLHRGGPGGVQLRGDQPGPDEGGDRPHLRRGPALLPAAGPRHHHGGGDPGLRDRRDRRQGGPHRAPGPLHAAHQRRPQHGHPAHEHGDRAVPRVVVAEPHRRAAAGPPGLHEMQGGDPGSPRRRSRTPG